MEWYINILHVIYITFSTKLNYSKESTSKYVPCECMHVFRTHISSRVYNTTACISRARKCQHYYIIEAKLSWNDIDWLKLWISQRDPESGHVSQRNTKCYYKVIVWNIHFVYHPQYSIQNTQAKDIGHFLYQEWQLDTCILKNLNNVMNDSLHCINF